MRIKDYQFLSIWEIAHRWEKVDLADSDPISVTSRLGERLRQLVWAAIHALNCYDVHGEEMPLEKLWFGLPKTSLAKQLDIAFHDPAAHAAILKKVFLSQVELQKTFRGVEELPEFWFEEWEIEEGRRYLGPAKISPSKPPQPMRPDQQDRRTCQEIAQKLWTEFPDMTIADMTKHPQILVEGNGKAYKGKNTLRNWLKEVAPDSVRKRRGRPKKSDEAKTPS